MNANPLIDHTQRRAGKVTVEMLYELADSLNRSNFVRDSDKKYFVNRKSNGDGTFTHYLDR